jgi:Zn-dependent protease
MRLQVKQCAVDVHFAFLAAVTLLLILDSSGTAVLGVAACIAHECGHIVTLILCGEHPRRIVLGAFGMRLERTGAVRLSLAQECLVALAGPGVNLALAGVIALVRRPEIPAFKTAAAVNLGLALFNLLPVEALDGGRALRFLLESGTDLPEARVQRLLGRVSLGVIVVLICLGVALLVHSGFNFTLLLVGVYLFLLFWFKADDR